MFKDHKRFSKIRAPIVHREPSAAVARRHMWLSLRNRKTIRKGPSGISMQKGTIFIPDADSLVCAVEKDSSKR